MAIDLKDYSRNAQDRGWGSGWPNCGGAKPNLATVVADVSGTRITVHKRIAVLVNLLIDYQEKVLGYLLKPAQTGGYNCRPIAGTNRSSNHAWALAIDENWADNPYTTSGQFKMPLSVPRLWNRYGFAWGGHYSGSRKDYMHLEAMGTPAEMDAMTVLAQQELSGATAPVRPTLRAGSTGDAVREVQTKMAIAVTGVFDQSTEDAVRRFQQANKLTVDGVVGPMTWAALDKVTPAKPAPTNPPTSEDAMTPEQDRMLREVHAQLTTAFPGWRWLNDGETQPRWTLVDFLRGLDQVVGSRFTLTGRPVDPAQHDTTAGHLLSLRAEVAALAKQVADAQEPKS